jgi:hypothetical protein
MRPQAILHVAGMPPVCLKQFTMPRHSIQLFEPKRVSLGKSMRIAMMLPQRVGRLGHMA